VLDTFRNTLHLLTTRERRGGAKVILLLALQSVFDFFSVASFLPLIVLIINPENIDRLKSVAYIFEYFRFANHSQFIVTAAIVVAIFTLLKNLFSIWVTHIKSSYAYRVGFNLSNRALDQYLNIKFSDFVKTDYATEVNRLLNFPITFSNHILLPLTTLASEIVVSALILSCVAFVEWKVVALCSFIFIPIIFIYLAAKGRMKNNGVTIKNKYPVALKYTQQTVEALVEIQTTDKKPFFKERLQKLQKEINHAFFKDAVFQSAAVKFTEVATSLIVCTFIVYATLTYQTYQQTMIMLSIFAGASFRLIPSFNRIIHSVVELKTHSSIIEELLKVKNTDVDNEYVSTPIIFNHSIQLKNIVFTYGAYRTILNGVSLKIQKGQAIAITGNSGEGKSTLLLLMLRLLKERSGELNVDDVALKNVMSWRKLIGYIPQNPFMLDATVLDNIAFGEAFPDRKKIIRLLDELFLSDLIREMPYGVDTVIGERGIKLSGGQKQRIAIARALYNNAEIFLMDEVTNQLHASLEEQILAMIGKLTSMKKTVVMVTHNKSQFQIFDAVYVLHEGKLHQLEAINV
jgi:ABC-type bacteriocin/lantibiotic exporter with double-glycine peptidase domain